MGEIIQQKSAVAAKGEKKTMQSYIKAMEGEIKKALPSVITPERFTRMVLSAISVNPKLGDCTPTSFLGAMMNAAQLGLEPNTPLGQAYILPYNNKGTMEAQFQIGYKGLIDLAWRSEEVSDIQAHVVYENDKFEYGYGLNGKLDHTPALKDKGEAIAVYAVFRTKNGGYGFEVMSMDDVRAHAEKYSKAFNSSYSPWATSFEEMAKKTVLKRVLKYAPLKSDFVRAVAQDGTIKKELSNDMYDVPGTIVVDDGSEVNTETGEATE
jgi:recombination protein RecT